MAVFKMVKTKWRCDHCGKETPYLEDDLQATEGWIVGAVSFNIEPPRWCSTECLEQWDCKPYQRYKDYMKAFFFKAAITDDIENGR